jgi:hypothetical protein
MHPVSGTSEPRMRLYCDELDCCGEGGGEEKRERDLHLNYVSRLAKLYDAHKSSKANFVILF